MPLQLLLLCAWSRLFSIYDFCILLCATLNFADKHHCVLQAQNVMPIPWLCNDRHSARWVGKNSSWRNTGAASCIIWGLEWPKVLVVCTINAFSQQTWFSTCLLGSLRWNGRAHELCFAQLERSAHYLLIPNNAWFSNSRSHILIHTHLFYYSWIYSLIIVIIMCVISLCCLTSYRIIGYLCKNIYAIIQVGFALHKLHSHKNTPHLFVVNRINFKMHRF